MRVSDPGDWPVLVTGAGGFAGGHVARELAAAGHPVRGLSRRPPHIEPGDPPIDWLIGDLRDPAIRAAAVAGMRGVIHTASWVSLGPDRSNQAVSSNVEATRGLLADCEAAGVERLVYTSTLHALAAGTAEAPANEDSPWNLERIDSPYARTKREAERMVLAGRGDRLECVVIIPGMVVGPRDIRPTSTGVLLAMARVPVAFVPGGGIPIVDTTVLARAHRIALSLGEPGKRYIVAGPYLSYPDMARLVARVAGWPRRVVTIADRFERPMIRAAGWAGRVVRKLQTDASPAVIAGSFLRLHAQSNRADSAFNLIHPPPIASFRDALADARHSGRARWLRLRDPIPSDPFADERLDATTS